MRCSVAASLLFASFAVAYDTCTSSTGAKISVLSPAQGQIVDVGQQLTIAWTIYNDVPAFDNVTVTFDIDDATNFNNVIPIQALPTTSKVLVTDGFAIVAVPSVPAVSLYSVRVIYNDVGSNEQRVCFSSSFVVRGATTGGGVATVSPTHSGSASLVDWFFKVVVSGILLMA